MTIQTAGQLRGFLADVLIDLREKRIKPDEAAAIAKVAAEINKSLAVEVSTALQSGVKKPVPGSMVIATPVMESEPAAQLPLRSDPPKNITENIPVADVIDPGMVQKREPVAELAVSLDDAAANYRRTKETGDKVWCDQCDMRVTVSQAVGCKSPHCKAKDAA